MAGVVRQRRRRPGARGPWCPLCLQHGVARTAADHKAPPCQYLFCWCWSCQTGSPFTREFQLQRGVTEFLAVKTPDVSDLVHLRDAAGEDDHDVVCLDDDGVVVLDDDDSVVVLDDEQDGVVVDLADEHRGTKAQVGISPGASTPETAASRTTSPPRTVPRTPTPDVAAPRTALPEAVSSPASAASAPAPPTTAPSTMQRPTVIVSPASPGPRPTWAPDEVSDEAASLARPPSPVDAASRTGRRHALRQRRVRSADTTAVSSEHIEQLLDSLPHSLAASMERGTRYCACCRNHGLAARLAGHSCPFADCPCDLCVSPPASAPAPAPAPAPSVDPVPKAGVRPRFCARCRAHGQTTPLSGHRGKCPHAECECSECTRHCRDRRARTSAPHPKKTALRLAASATVLPPLSDVTPPSSEPSLSPALDDVPSLEPPSLTAMSPPWSPASPDYSLQDSADESLACRWCGQQFDDRAGLDEHCESHVTPESDADADGAPDCPPVPGGVSEAEDVAVEDVAVEDVAVEDVAVEDVAVEDVAVEGDAVEEEAGVVEDEEEDAVVVEDAHGRVEEEPPPCEECGLQEASRLSLARHALAAHALPCRYECEVCGACFSSRGRLQLHAGLEHSGLSERCDRCPDRFPTPLLVNVHLLVDHKTAVLLSCPSCSAKFATIRALRAHLDGDADGGSECSPPRCEVCAGGPFPDVGQLLAHHYRHLADVRASHCAVCVAWFPTAALLQAHEADAHGDPPQFACPVAKCGVFAPTAEALSLHQYNSHRNRRPYRCPCGKAFSRLNRFSQHVVSSLHMLPVVRGPAPGARLTHACARCGLTAEDLVHIRDHEAVSHMGLLPMDRVAQLMSLLTHAHLVSAAQ